MTNLIDGFLHFRKNIFPEKRTLFRQLAGAQNPMALFITCADSRVVPDLITQSQPGDLFICRTVGNQIPPHGTSIDGVASSIEYAVLALGVQHVVVCGHSDCGAMKALLHPEKVRSLPETCAWLRHAAVARSVVVENNAGVTDEVLLHLLTEENVIAQIEHLKTHPAIAARLARGEVKLHGWLYHIQSGEITTYDAHTGRFVPLDHDAPTATPPRRWHQYEAVGGTA